LLGGAGSDNRKAMALTTSLRNVGVGLVIATGSFSGTAAVTAAMAYGIFEIVGSLLLALRWGRAGKAAGRGTASTGMRLPPLRSGARRTSPGPERCAPRMT